MAEWQVVHTHKRNLFRSLSTAGAALLPRAIIDLSSFPVVGHSRAGAERHREKELGSLLLATIVQELYTPAMANETRVKEETQLKASADEESGGQVENGEKRGTF